MKNNITNIRIDKQSQLPKEHSEVNIFVLSDELRHKVWDQNPNVSVVYLVNEKTRDYLYIYISSTSPFYARITIEY